MKNKFITDEDVDKKFGVKPESVIDVQALARDSTDNVPGVPGIGVKTAAELIKEYGTLENLLKNANKIKQNTNIVVRTSGLIHDLGFANKVIKKNKCDLIAVGRKFILDPNLIQRIKKESIKSIPPQYLRGLI